MNSEALIRSIDLPVSEDNQLEAANQEARPLRESVAHDGFQQRDFNLSQYHVVHINGFLAVELIEVTLQGSFNGLTQRAGFLIGSFQLGFLRHGYFD